MRDAIPLLLLACACGVTLRDARALGPAPEPIAAARGPAGRATATASAASQDAERGARLASLRAQGAVVAPGMRLVAAREADAGDLVLLRADAQDECVRAAFEASVPVAAALTDARRAVLSEVGEPATAGVLGEGGPVCVRKGDRVIGVARGTEDGGGPAPRVTWAAWAAP